LISHSIFMCSINYNLRSLHRQSRPKIKHKEKNIENVLKYLIEIIFNQGGKGNFKIHLNSILKTYGFNKLKMLDDMHTLRFHSFPTLSFTNKYIFNTTYIVKKQHSKKFSEFLPYIT
jgi:hypothetical protein